MSELNVGTQEDENEAEWLCFRISGERYCQDVMCVDEVLRYSAPTPVPGAPGYVEGILNIRGNVISVYSGRKLLGLEETEPTEQSRIITCVVSGELFGVLVDSVEEINRFNPEAIESVVSNEPGSHLIKGTVTIGHKLYVVVDFSEFER